MSFRRSKVRIALLLRTYASPAPSLAVTGWSRAMAAAVSMACLESGRAAVAAEFGHIGPMYWLLPSGHDQQVGRCVGDLMCVRHAMRLVFQCWTLPGSDPCTCVLETSHRTQSADIHLPRAWSGTYAYILAGHPKFGRTTCGRPGALSGNKSYRPRCHARATAICVVFDRTEWRPDLGTSLL
jgi:hypothetical protein